VGVTITFCHSFYCCREGNGTVRHWQCCWPQLAFFLEMNSLGQVVSRTLTLSQSEIRSEITYIFNKGGWSVTLHKSLVRCHLEYTNPVRNARRQGLIKDLEKVQMRATKTIWTSWAFNVLIKELLRQLNAPTLKYRCTRGDMIEVCKILTGRYDSSVIFSFDKHHHCRTRRHNLKLVSHRCHYDYRKYFFSRRMLGSVVCWSWSWHDLCGGCVRCLRVCVFGVVEWASDGRSRVQQLGGYSQLSTWTLLWTSQPARTPTG